MDSLSGAQIGGLIALFSFILLVVGVATGWAVRINAGERANASVKRAHERIDELGKAVHGRIDTVIEGQGQFREQVAREYVSLSAVDKLEERLMSAIERLGDRFDRYVDGPPTGSRRRRTSRSAD